MDREAAEQVRWTCENGERRELRRAAGSLTVFARCYAVASNPAHAAKILAQLWDITDGVIPGRALRRQCEGKGTQVERLGSA
jgi:hypothetical protein